jgi:hypothetical protein
LTLVLGGQARLEITHIFALQPPGALVTLHFRESGRDVSGKVRLDRPLPFTFRDLEYEIRASMISVNEQQATLQIVPLLPP